MDHHLRSPDPHIAIALSSITKTFGSVEALFAAHLTVRPNTIHALLGENGAGKTTLMRIAFGMIQPDAGTISIDGTPRRLRSSADAIAAGIGMVHQHFTLVPAMTVAENVALGEHGLYNAQLARERVHALCQKTGLTIDPDARISTLSVGAQQRVEILKALAKNARILILDEPTAVLAPDAARDLLRTLRSFADTQGTVILITHKLQDALDFADDVTVLRKGQTVLTKHASELHKEELAHAMLGDTPPRLSTTANTRPTTNHRGKPRVVFHLHNVDATNLRGVKTIKQATLAVHSTEIVGIAAVEGNGQHELLRVLAGRLPASAGFVEIPDVVGFIPEDRHNDALILDFPLYENVALFNAGPRSGTIPWKEIQRKTATLIDSYDVRAANVNTPARTLSGGNQQKLVISRELEGAPEALVVENPTRGLDIQATRAVHDRLISAKHNGAAIVLYSNDLDEIIQLADRVFVLYSGSLYEAPNEHEVIGKMMLGITEPE